PRYMETPETRSGRLKLAYVGGIALGLDEVRETATKGANPVDLPAAQNPAQGARFQPGTAGAPGQLVDEIQVKYLRHIQCRVGFGVLGIVRVQNEHGGESREGAHAGAVTFEVFR